MKKKIYIIMALLLVVSASALLTYFGQVTRTVTVNPAIDFTGDNAAPVEIEAGETVISNELNVESQTTVNVPLSIETTVDPDEEGITHTVQYLLDNAGGVCPGDSCEKRIFIRAEDVGITTLNDLDTISWDVNVLGGYIAHVDVILETDALVFEYAKVDTPCDNAQYPTGVQNTFGDKGIVDSDAKAWLSSGVPGPCGLQAFDDNHKSLTDWKTVRGSENVIGFEIEIDNWISESDSTVKNILINGEEVEVTLKSSDSLSFNVETIFGLLNVGGYTITTTVEPTN